MTVNTYSTKFFCRCPNNDVRVEYALRISTQEVLAVEQIIDGIEIDTAEPEYHEALADTLLSRFGGTQMLVAEHHGVRIETERSTAAADHPPESNGTGSTNHAPQAASMTTPASAGGGKP